MKALEFRRLIEARGIFDAARDVNKEIATIDQANLFIRGYIQSFLHARMYAQAALVLWGRTIFDARPECVRGVWRNIEKSAKSLVQGAGSSSKSYSGIVWTYLDWQADPEFTTVKLISTSGGHARSNTFSTLLSLHKNACVPMPGIPRAETLSLYETDRRSCISIVRIREGEDNSGVLQGFHPLPRSTPHPVFGTSSRVRAVLDEAEEIPNGVWSGVDNMLVSIDGVDSVKVMGFYNPKDISSKTASLAEPQGGWGEFDTETGVRGSDEWISRMGWSVLRLDAAKIENVKQRKVLYPGLQTYEGYRLLEMKDGGNSLSYFTFGRGAYPPDSAVQVVVQQRILALMRGEMIFTGKTTKIGGVDIAIDGRDEAVFSSGRWGRASGIRRLILSPSGEATWQNFMFPGEHAAAQLDQQFALPKGSAEIVGKAIKSNSVRLGILPENMTIDATGNGSPVWNYLKIPEVWSPKVQGIDFGKSATDTKILEEDDRLCSDLYEGIHTESWFRLARMGEHGYFCISPSVRSENLERELLGRRYILGHGQTLRLEKKEDYKKRLGRSPDNADSAVTMIQGMASGAPMEISMLGKDRPKEDYTREEPGVRDAVSWFRDHVD